jgi:metallopeptidase family M12-like protein
MDSVRAFATCIGISGEFSVARQFFGFLGQSVPQVSVATQINRLKGRHVHMNFIRVGSDQFTNANFEEMDQALQFTRDTYSTVSLGVGRIEHYVISTADADGADNIDNDDEAEDLTNDWTVPNSALDIFWVRTYATTTIGLSAVDGPCDKDAKGMDGSVVAIEGSNTTTGYVLAHEAGHYLGNEHTDSDSTNLMFPTVPNGGKLTSSQGSNMRDHCFTKKGCP